MIDLNPQFTKTLHLMEKTSSSIFITGRAGTGKTTLLNLFKQKTKKNFIVTAPTGTSAVNIDGDTIHRVFGFDPSTTPAKAKKLAKRGKFHNAKLLSIIDTLVIDEISMVRADIFDSMDIVLKVLRDSSEPFGGVQLLMFGDLYQLPPVLTNDEKESFLQVYSGTYFFNSKVFEEMNNPLFGYKFEFIELDKIYRQKDIEFIDILNAIRNNSITFDQLKLLNSRIVQEDEQIDNDEYIYLTTVNAKADYINKINLDRLHSKSKIYQAEISGKYSKDRYYTQDELVLKKDARIMMLYNDPDGNFINGSCGFVKKINDNSIVVELDNGYVGEIGYFMWELYESKYDEKTRSIEKTPTGSFKQIPVRLAWAITIHKSQGKTFNKVIIDLGNYVFSEGQTYVALSRCTSLKGIRLVRPVRMNDVRVDREVVRFVSEKFNSKLKTQS